MIRLVLLAVGAASSAGALPVGHPRVDHGDDEGTAVFRPPPDTADEDPTVAPGAITVELRDAQNHAVASHAVELGIIQQSVAKGESRKHLSATTSADGSVTFDSLDRSSNVAYRVTAREGEAVFAARPFQMAHDHGMRVVIHVYPATSDYRAHALIITRGVVYIELKDDRVQIQQRLDIFNGSPVAWVPHDVVLKLPDGFTALTSMQQMSDIGVDAVEHRGARLHGTFAPGENAVMFNWQVPYSGEPSIDIDVGVPPNLAQLIVRAAAAPGMKLSVPGFRDPISQMDEEGQRELVTGRQIQPGEGAITTAHVELRNLPTPGPTRFVATGLAGLGVAAGVLALRRPTRRKKGPFAKRERERLLALLDDLEAAHETGEVGPKTYERARRDLIDELAALLMITATSGKSQ